MALSNEKRLVTHITAGTEDGFMTTADVIKDETENQSVQETLDAKYSKPASGIPKADLDASVKASLEKADEAARDTKDYEKLVNKPAISGAEINKDSTASSLGLATSSQVNSKQPKIDEDHKISADYIDDLVSEQKLVSRGEKETWNKKQEELGPDNAGDNITISKENGIVKISAAGAGEVVRDVIFDGSSVVNPDDKIARLNTDPALRSAKETKGIGYKTGTGATEEVHKIDPNYLDSTGQASGKAIVSDGTGGVTWGEAGKVDDVLFDDVSKLDPDKKVRLYTDPALKNAKETGGIGWSEAGTTPVTISWDGNTAAKKRITGSDEFPLYQINSTIEISKDAAIGATAVVTNGGDDTTINITADSIVTIEDLFGELPEGASANDWFSGGGFGSACWVGCIHNAFTYKVDDETTMSFPKGLLFYGNGDGGPSALYTKSFTYTPATRHKIDYRYINSGESYTAGKFLKSDGSGGVNWETVVTLRPMKDRWCSGCSTAEAVERMFEDGVQPGEGYLGGVAWTDFGTYPAPEIGNGEVKAFVINDWIVEFQLTSSDTSPYSWFYNSASGTWRSQTPVVDNLESDNFREALSAKQGKVLNEGKQDKLPDGDPDTYLHKKTDGSLEWAAVQQGGTEETTILANELYTFAPIGKLQTEGGQPISDTNPKKVADVGQSLKDVFNAILGTEQDANPTINAGGTTLTKSAQTGTTSASGGEVGLAIAAQTGTVTFKVTNTATCSYGLKTSAADTYNKKSATTFVYPVKQRSQAGNNYQLRIKYPALNGCTLSVTTGTLVLDDTANRYLYCNLSNNNTVVVSISIPAGASTTAAQTRFGQLEADISFEPATYNGNLVQNFWTYLKNPYTASGMSHADITGVKSTAYTITAGVYYPYYMFANTTTIDQTIAQGIATKSTDEIVYSPTSSLADPGKSVTYTFTGNYIYFLVPTNKTHKYIHEYAAGSWNDWGTTDDGLKTLTLNSGATASYKAYRSDNQQIGSTPRLRIQINKVK